MVQTSTIEDWIYDLKCRNNARAVKSPTVVIFEDTKGRVVSLIKRLTMMISIISDIILVLIKKKLCMVNMS